MKHRDQAGILASLSVVLLSLAAGALGGCESGGKEAATKSAGARAMLAGADTAADFRTIISGAKGKVFPAVVFVKCLRQDFATGESASTEVSGSGVVISAKGEVLTNWHVVDKAVSVRCLLFDGRALEAKVVGSDKDTDVALLELVLPAGEKADFQHANFGDSNELKEGDFVMAMGAPWGLARSVSLGIISCTKRYLPGTSEYSSWLQTDAAISPGNSGGPLVNTKGEVVGINTRGMTYGGDMGFAVPSAVVTVVVEQLRKGGVNWAFTGIQLQPLKDFNRNMYFDGNDGVIIADVDPDSPAKRAGLQARDRIMQINGKAVSAITDEDLPYLRRLLGSLPKSEPAKLQIMRGEESQVIEVTPREKGKVEGESLAAERWDCTVRAINQFETPDLYFRRKEGVFIYGIKYPGNASTSGLQQQDIVIKVNQDPIKTLAEFSAAHKKTLATVHDQPRVVLTILRNGLMRQVVLDISREMDKQ